MPSKPLRKFLRFALDEAVQFFLAIAKQFALDNFSHLLLKNNTGFSRLRRHVTLSIHQLLIQSNLCKSNYKFIALI